MSRMRGERTLAVVGAACLLVVGFDAVTYAATGSSLLLGKVNKAGAVTTVQNTGSGAALNLLTKSTASPPFTTNAKGQVKNLFAARAAAADRATLATTATTATNALRLGGLTYAQIEAAAAARTATTRRLATQQLWDVGSLTYRGGSYGFDAPFGLAYDGDHIWVTNPSPNTVT